jgi:muramoyltetrapeptide carboxypeptidase
MAELTKPAHLRPGSTIAIIAPAGTPRPEKLRRGLSLLKRHGYNLKIYPQVKRKLGYLAGNDRTRAQALTDAFVDDEVDGIFAARGGYGCLRLLPLIDFDIIRRYPKVFAGYSDLTALLLSIYKQCGFVTFHGPMASIEFGRRPRVYSAAYFFKAVEEKDPLGIIKVPSGYKLTTIKGGLADGLVVGGNLSMLARMTGTGFLPSFENKIVFFEDTDEEPYRLDAYLAQLFMATDISRASGFIIGEMTRFEPRYGGHMKGWSVIQVMRDYFSTLNKPAIFGFPCGHGKEKITIPIGVRLFLDADRKKVEFLESGVQ